MGGDGIEEVNPDKSLTSTMVHFQLRVSRMWTSLNHFLFLDPPNTKMRSESGS